ncbi:hypothetical protein [Microbulbifer hainanensis]|uniref:hypothetical protein n=1 Tax=Microbulbifer hainanensis TaxID=2735675 RepID=UPI0018662A22|nr:hypothetical protein [Microbulbifer hainanensis]
MKSLLTLGAAVAFIATGSAYADTSVDIPLSGHLCKTCNVTAFLNGPFDDLDMTTTAQQGFESLSPICNYGGTLTVTFTSLNAGFLESGPNSVGYTLQVSGGLLAPTQLTVPAVVNNWPAVANAVQTRSLSVALLAVATVAGTYTDTITASVTPN